jgi:hypothetical protein
LLPTANVQQVILLPTADVQQVSYIAKNSWCKCYIAANNWCTSGYIAAHS